MLNKLFSMCKEPHKIVLTVVCSKLLSDILRWQNINHDVANNALCLCVPIHEHEYALRIIAGQKQYIDAHFAVFLLQCLTGNFSVYNIHTCTTVSLMIEYGD